VVELTRGRAALAVILAPLALAGCFMSLQDLRATPPDRTGLISGDTHTRLANCVGETLIAGGRMPYQIIPRSDLGRTAIIGFTDHFHDKPMLDLQFIQQADTVRVEGRWGRQPIGALSGGHGAARLDREAWPALTRCAGTRPIQMRSAR
jgi:hypothetical protein